MTPYGYEIRDAKAVIIPAEAEKLHVLFTRFIDGFSLVDCAAESEIERTTQTCKKMLGNRVYLGTDFYPQIIHTELFQKAQDELKRRTEERQPMVKPKQIIAAPVYTEFCIPEERDDVGATEPDSYPSLPCDPQTYAAYMYGRIKPLLQSRTNSQNGKETHVCQ